MRPVENFTLLIDMSAEVDCIFNRATSIAPFEQNTSSAAQCRQTPPLRMDTVIRVLGCRNRSRCVRLSTSTNGRNRCAHVRIWPSVDTTTPEPHEEFMVIMTTDSEHPNTASAIILLEPCWTLQFLTSREVPLSTNLSSSRFENSATGITVPSSNLEPSGLSTVEDTIPISSPERLKTGAPSEPGRHRASVNNSATRVESCTTLLTTPLVTLF
mmetsp:Transcript_9300/g.15133  ORF Transcript_9300/g.15133 Transcript_9300/m.15133 type:complete len:213 (-) Transcript_9300:742-1380(-)